MKANIEVEVENEEDLKQLENELETAINHTTHLEGEAQVIKSYRKDLDPANLVEGTILEAWSTQNKDQLEAITDELMGRDVGLEFVGIDFIFVAEDESFEQRSKIHRESYREEEYE